MSLCISAAKVRSCMQAVNSGSATDDANGIKYAMTAWTNCSCYSVGAHWLCGLTVECTSSIEVSRASTCYSRHSLIEQKCHIAWHKRVQTKFTCSKGDSQLYQACAWSWPEVEAHATSITKTHPYSNSTWSNNNDLCQGHDGFWQWPLFQVVCYLVVDCKPYDLQ